jgi:hypothetical protein
LLLAYLLLSTIFMAFAFLLSWRLISLSLLI